MAILPISAFKQEVGYHTALLALDVSSKAIGLAVSSGLRVSATALKTIKRSKLKQDAQSLFEYYDSYDCKGLVVGWPLEMNDRAGPRCQSVRDFTLALLQIRDVPACFFDERMSTQEAESHMIDTLNMSRKKRQKNIDKMAAQLILKNALATLK